ncbi:MAG: hypothetical protein MAG453_00177 [Calditrichaeota bacterium]|nr:hypothetical protein [Calditrichota bacterium]
MAISATLTGELPLRYTLAPPYPNPFNAATTVTITLPEASKLVVAVYNTAGQSVATVAAGSYPAGRHALSFNGSALASGLYFLRATVPGQLDETRKIMLVR